MTLAQDLPTHCSTASGSSALSTPARHWSPGLCVWCGGEDSIEVYKNEHRCATCRQHESIVAEARDFLGMYGLRPLGGSLDSEDEEEREHRVAARDARAALNASRLAEPPSREQIRKAMTGTGSSAVERVESISVDSADTAAQPQAARKSRPSRTRAPRKTEASTGSGRARSARTASGPATDVDLQTLESRVTTLLDKLSAIDTQITEKSSSGGLAARARIKDLERQRTTVLHTLAALEKARRLQTG
ncbi:hypothetical protein [Tomitella fengzijianii]|uniref:hypothetical protein n=1 Tax=Tomitella fengzijianii TaxID=2597660 RepID=UPI001E5F75EA|nr:hypothetical protein [Tomitella fengzijianii]